jgi:MFS family permease
MEPAPQQSASPLRQVVSAILTRPVMFAFWLVILPSMLSGLFDVLVPLRLDALGAGGLAVGAAFFGAAALESFTAPAIGKLSDRRGRMTPIRLGLIASPLAALALPLPDSAILVAVALVVVVLAMSLIWTPAMALLSDNAEVAGLDLAFATALVSLAWAGGQVVGGSALSTFADATSDATSYAFVAAMFVLTLATVLVRRPAAEPAPG